MYRKAMFKVSPKDNYDEKNKTKGTPRVTIGYLPDYYTATYRLLYHGYGVMRQTYIYINKI